MLQCWRDKKQKDASCQCMKIYENAQHPTRSPEPPPYLPSFDPSGSDTSPVTGNMMLQLIEKGSCFSMWQHNVKSLLHTLVRSTMSQQSTFSLTNEMSLQQYQHATDWSVFERSLSARTTEMIKPLLCAPCRQLHIIGTSALKR